MDERKEKARERDKAYHKLWYRENRDRVAERTRRYYEKNRSENAENQSRLREKRKALRYSQRAVAELVGCTQSEISRLESGSIPLEGSRHGWKLLDVLETLEGMV